MGRADLYGVPNSDPEKKKGVGDYLIRLLGFDWVKFFFATSDPLTFFLSRPFLFLLFLLFFLSHNDLININ